MKNILVFQHIAREAPSYIAEYAKDKNVGLDVVEFWKPYSIPDVSRYDGLVILGGPMGAYEDFPSKNDEIFTITKHAGSLPMLGVCLGAQLMARALGARVYPHKRDGKHIKEIGYYTVELTPEGQQNKLFRGFPPTVKVLQWHGDTFDIPEGGTRLATAPLCENQAFSTGMMHGLQFHFEMSPPLLEIIATTDREWAHTDFTLDEERLFLDAQRFEPVMKKQCYQLLDNFLSL